MDLRQIMQETRNEELVHEREREARAKNIIIHGFNEAGNINEVKEGGNNTIRELLNILEIDAFSQSITRLANRNGQNLRPMKMKMKSLNDKELLMSSLGKLKNASEKFQRISVTEDYTLDERQMVKSKVTEAKSKTENEGEGMYVWRVRGSPKYGLRLVKFMVTMPANRAQLN